VIYGICQEPTSLNMELEECGPFVDILYSNQDGETGMRIGR